MATTEIAAEPSKNGSASREKAKRNFLSSPTSRYQPTGAGYYYAAASAVDGQPVFTLPWDVERMSGDPGVIFIEGLWRAPFQRQKFKVLARSKNAANFVENTMVRFKRASVPALMSWYFNWGYSAGGAEYVVREGRMRLDRVRAVSSRDARPLVFDGGDMNRQFAGFRARDGAGAGEIKVHSPHAFWFAGRKKFGQFYDRPPLSGLFQPWLENNGRGGAKHMRRLWFRKNAVRGMIGRYPPGVTTLGSDEGGVTKTNQDVMRETLDYAESQGVFCFENTANPAIEGRFDWEIEDLQAHGDVVGYLDYPDKLFLDMLKGAGIPQEVVQSSESGSGYNGRLIPYQGFLGLVDELWGNIVEASESWLRPLVEFNFGKDTWYEVEPLSLAEQAEQEEMEGQQRSGQMPAKPGAGGDIPFALSTLDAERVRGGWQRTDSGNFVKWRERRNSSRGVTLELSTTDTDGSKVHKFSSTHVLLPAEVAAVLSQLAARVPDSALADDGREDEFHVTVRYGLHTDSAEQVRDIIESAQPIRMALGGVSVFRGADSGKDYDVLKVDVSSPDLRRLNRELAALPHTDTFKDYCPHATIAYVKAGMGDQFAALAPALNAEFTAGEVVFSNRGGEKTTIPLMGKPPVARTDPAVLDVLNKLAEGLALLAAKQQSPPLELAATVTPEDDPQEKARAFEATAQKLTRQRKSTVVQLLALAMVRAQQRATQAGKPEAAAGSLKALAEMAGDPVQVAKVVGMQEMSAVEMSALELAWTQGQGPKGGTYWVNSDTGEKRYQKTKPGERKEKQEASEKRGWEIIKSVAKRRATPEEVAELATHLPVMRGRELMKARTWLEANLRGERKKNWMVERLLDHVERADVTGKARAPEKSRAAKPGKHAGTVAEAVSRMGGIDPTDHEFLTHYGSVKEAIDDGIPRAAFQNRNGQRGRGGLDTLARELMANGHITIPEGQRESEYVLNLLKKVAKVHGEEDHGDLFKGEEERAKREQEQADRARAEAAGVDERGYPASWDDPIPEAPGEKVAEVSDAAPEPASAPTAEVERLTKLRDRYAKLRDDAKAELEHAFPNAAKNGGTTLTGASRRGYDDRVKAVQEQENNLKWAEDELAKSNAPAAKPTATAKDYTYGEPEPIGGGVKKIGVTDPSTGEEIGHVEYSVDGDSLTVNDVKVHSKHRRRGIATELYDRMRAANPGKKLATRLQSEDGQKFRASYDKRAEPAPAPKEEAGVSGDTPEPPPAPVAKEIEKQVEKPAEPAKKPRNTPSVVSEDESKKLKAAVAYNALLEAAQQGASGKQIDKLHERAKQAATEFAPEKDRDVLLKHLELATKGKGKLLPLPKAGEVEDVNPDEELPTEAESKAAEEKLRKALAGDSPDATDDEPEVDDDAPPEKSVLQVKAEKARGEWQKAVAAKKASAPSLKKRFDEYVAALPDEERAAVTGAPGNAKKAVSGILADPETQALLAKRRAKLEANPAPAKSEPAPESAKPKSAPALTPKQRDAATVRIANESKISSEPPPPVDPAAKKPWEMNADEFLEAAQRGKKRLASGRALPGEEEAKTWLKLGEINGYHPDDIAHFYVANAGKRGEGFDAAHRSYLSDAIAEGRGVPAEVASQYPELAKPKSPPKREEKKPAKVKEPKPPKPDRDRRPTGASAVEQMAKAEADPAAKDWLESALHNAREGDDADLAKTLGSSIEETGTDAKGEPLTRRIPQAAVEAGRKALIAMGAEPHGPESGEAEFDPRYYQPAPGAFKGDKVEVVRPPLVLGGNVVSRGVVRKKGGA